MESIFFLGCHLGRATQLALCGFLSGHKRGQIDDIGFLPELALDLVNRNCWELTGTILDSSTTGLSLAESCYGPVDCDMMWLREAESLSHGFLILTSPFVTLGQL